MDHHHPIQFGAVTASGIAQLHERDDVPYSLVLIDPIPAHFDPETVHKPALSHMSPLEQRAHSLSQVTDLVQLAAGKTSDDELVSNELRSRVAQGVIDDAWSLDYELFITRYVVKDCPALVRGRGRGCDP